MTGVHSQSCLVSTYICPPSTSHTSRVYIVTPLNVPSQVHGLLFLPLYPPFFSLVSGPPLEVTHALLLAFENTHPNLHLLMYFFFYLQKCISAHKPEGPGPGQHGKVTFILLSHSLQWEVPWFSEREPIFFHDISRFSFNKITETLPWTLENSMQSDRSDFDCRSYILLSTQHVVDNPLILITVLPPSLRQGNANGTTLCLAIPQLPYFSSPSATGLCSWEISYQLSCGFRLVWIFIGVRKRKLTVY